MLEKQERLGVHPDVLNGISCLNLPLLPKQAGLCGASPLGAPLDSSVLSIAICCGILSKSRMTQPKKVSSLFFHQSPSYQLVLATSFLRIVDRQKLQLLQQPQSTKHQLPCPSLG